MLKNTQLVSEEISEDMASAKEELDEAVPIHTLLDVSANRSKAELAHKGLLSQRQRPSTEALRATVLRKSVSTLSSASDSGFPVRIYFYRFSGRLGRQGGPGGLGGPGEFGRSGRAGKSERPSWPTRASCHWSIISMRSGRSGRAGKSESPS